MTEKRGKLGKWEQLQTSEGVGLDSVVESPSPNDDIAVESANWSPDNYSRFTQLYLQPLQLRVSDRGSYLVLVASGTTSLAKLPPPLMRYIHLMGWSGKQFCLQCIPTPRQSLTPSTLQSKHYWGTEISSLDRSNQSLRKQWKKNWYFTCQIRHVLCGPVAPWQIRYFISFFFEGHFWLSMFIYWSKITGLLGGDKGYIAGGH